MNMVNWRLWRSERVGHQAPKFRFQAEVLLLVGTPRPDEHIFSCGAMGGAVPQGPTNNSFDFFPPFFISRPSNFHGYFLKHLGSLAPSTPSIFDSKNNPKTRIKSIIGRNNSTNKNITMFFKNFTFLSFNQLKIVEFKNFCVWLN